MGIFDFLNRAIGESEAKDLKKERREIKQNLKKRLFENLHFTYEEVDEVISIIRRAELDIMNVKKSVETVNINNDNTEQDVEAAAKKIEDIGKIMAENVNNKIKEIVQRKTDA